MSALTRKQREVLQRESFLLDVARKMLMEHGFAGLSMDRLAEASEYSKGTIYQHFSTKEDLVAALAVQSTEQRRELFQRARGYRGRSRERMFAMGVADELFARLSPQYYQAEMIIRLANLRDRADARRRRILLERDRECVGWVREIIQSALDDGDLRLHQSWTPERLALATFSIAVGTQLGLLNDEALFEGPISGSRYCLMRESVNAMLDGFGWRPLYSVGNYAETRLRILETVFPDEWRRVEPG